MFVDGAASVALEAHERARVGEEAAPAPRRTFAIISHPDAGKTTLTEKLLLFAGAIQLAGAVKARGDRRRARSDWMEIERAARHLGVELGDDLRAPGPGLQPARHAGPRGLFSEDTYRTLTAVDSAVMVIDAAKGIEAQTRKLFEVCRLRDVPIITFINKIDREGRDPFELLDEIEQTLALDVAPVTWPIGMGDRVPRQLRPAPRPAAAAERGGRGGARDGLRRARRSGARPAGRRGHARRLPRGRGAGARPAPSPTSRPIARAT